MRTNQIIHTYKYLFGTIPVFMLVHPTMHRNVWHLSWEVYRNTLMLNTYLATPPVQLESAKFDQFSVHAITR